MPIPETTASYKMIDWGIAQLEKDDKLYRELVRNAQNIVSRLFLEKPKGKVLTRLRQKMNLGAKNYKHIETDMVKIMEELDNEALDLVGWQLVKMWNTKGGGRYEQ